MTVYYVGIYTRNNTGKWSSVSVDSKILSRKGIYLNKSKNPIKVFFHICISLYIDLRITTVYLSLLISFISKLSK